MVKVYIFVFEHNIPPHPCRTSRHSDYYCCPGSAAGGASDQRAGAGSMAETEYTSNLAKLLVIPKKLL